MVVGFMASRTGRWLRIVTGSCLVLGGLRTGTARGAAVALLGLGPLVAASLDLVLLGPLFGLPMRGSDIRRELGVTGEASLLNGHRRASSRCVSMTLH
ncbi:hypothetical protein HUA74_06480 [Myxococcus sp. CA051A]|nr:MULTISPECIES: hypothetical protein [Myxococcus]NTX02604.1 hypothetical protein [Myxococcus sp. CA040A]NTX11025.1 hypothetical protein [Myxococcus sp. CA056]NTX40878.1 hypothetical protein [Myxococcus sp. CA033]NTX50469.1 hypothetical protein [Myxococcus sp. CA039A]NTX60300.1 hypothetical protein [Myxococcus sp. CA051A]